MLYFPLIDQDLCIRLAELVSDYLNIFTDQEGVMSLLAELAPLAMSLLRKTMDEIEWLRTENEELRKGKARLETALGHVTKMEDRHELSRTLVLYCVHA